MSQTKRYPVLLMVDDDDEDIYLTRRAFCNYRNDLIFYSVHSGPEMFDYLYFRNDYKNSNSENLPDIILLDINIPKENGYAVIKKLRADEKFAHIPVTMLTTSSAAHDIKKAYESGASSYICKSVSSEGMQSVAKHFCDYWFGFAKLPIAS